SSLPRESVRRRPAPPPAATVRSRARPAPRDPSGRASRQPQSEPRPPQWPPGGRNPSRHPFRRPRDRRGDTGRQPAIRAPRSTRALRVGQHNEKPAPGGAGLQRGAAHESVEGHAQTEMDDVLLPPGGEPADASLVHVADAAVHVFYGRSESHVTAVPEL